MSLTVASSYMDSTIATVYTGDTVVTPYIDGVGYFKRIHDQILATVAGDHIFIVNWQIDPYMDLEGPPTQPVDPPASLPPNCLLSLLVTKAAAGVDVKLVLNGGSYLYGFSSWNKCIIAAEAFRAMPSLQDSVLYDWSGANDGTQHQKATLISVAGDMFAYIGGMDYWPIRLDEKPYNNQNWPDGSVWGWHDAGIEVHGKAVEAAWENFRLRWAEAATLPSYKYQKVSTPGEFPFNPSGSPSDVPAFPGAQAAAGASPTVSTQILRSRWKVKESNFGRADTSWDSAPPDQITEIFDALKTAIDAASTYIYFEDQFLDDTGTTTPGVGDEMSIFPHLQQAAARGVKVILLGSGKGDPDDWGGPSLRNQQWPEILPPLPPILPVPNRVSDMVSQLDQMSPPLGHNVVVWRFDNITVHAKLALIDDVFCSIGSANMQSRSMAGIDSELTCAFVDSATQVCDFRVQLWANHFRIPSPIASGVLDALENIDIALGLWRPEWLPKTAPAGTWETPNQPPGFTQEWYSAGTQLTFVGPPF
jgi:phosphatidylserine/phosphatidylglycerophosphate/cardiolipin synthase-like enzyme